MPFAQVPTESKTRINKAGETLVIGPIDGQYNEYLDAIDLAERWRACHAYPINTFQATLRRKLSNWKSETIVAQRLKRMPTIIDKLQRFPNMKLTTMQDIGGVRTILPDVKSVALLVNEYRNNSRFAHELVDEKNYIENPRGADGYRSHHLIYKYRNRQFPAYDGLKVELQIRTKLQHSWATAVETMGTFLGQALKSRQGDDKWLDFFALTSSAFAYKERRPTVPRFSHLTKSETFQAVAEAENALGALEKMNGFSLAVDKISTSNKLGRGYFYHLIILDSLNHRVEVKPYDRESFQLAMEEYTRYEAEASKGYKIEPVLVSAGPISKLRKAYPNFFLDIGDFAMQLQDIVEKSKH